MYVYIYPSLFPRFSLLSSLPPSRSIANRLTVVDNSIFDLSSISDRFTAVFPIRLKIESPIIIVIIIIIIIIIVSLRPIFESLPSPLSNREIRYPLPRDP